MVNNGLDTAGAHGVGLATVTDDGTVLDTWFPNPEPGPSLGSTTTGTVRIAPDETPEQFAALLGPDPARGLHLPRRLDRPATHGPGWRRGLGGPGCLAAIRAGRRV